MKPIDPFQRNFLQDDERNTRADSRSVSPALSIKTKLNDQDQQNQRTGGQNSQFNQVLNDFDDRSSDISPRFGGNIRIPPQPKLIQQPTQEAVSGAKSAFLSEMAFPGIPDGQIVDCSLLPHPPLLFKDGCYYGMMENKNPEGYGLFWFNSGDVYIGTWRKGMPQGHGFYYLSEGGFYFGQIDCGLASGYGIYYRAQDEFYYQGTFDAGLLDGKGYLNLRSVPYDCLTKNNNITFTQKRPLQNNARIELPPKLQSFQDELIFISLMTNPETQITARNSRHEFESVYFGERNEKGQRHGVGTVINANGSRYHGMFFEDKPLGLGVAVDPSNNMRYGLFSKSGLHIYGSSFTDIDIYIGGYFSGQYYGPGYYYDCQYSKWIMGFFENGDISIKTYGGDGKLTLEHTKLGGEILAYILEKAFAGYYKIEQNLGCNVLFGRSHSIHVAKTADNINDIMENTYFRKLIAQYLIGNTKAKKEKFDGAGWERRSKSPIPSTKEMYKQVFKSFLTDPAFQQQGPAQSNMSNMGSPPANSVPASAPARLPGFPAPGQGQGFDQPPQGGLSQQSLSPQTQLSQQSQQTKPNQVQGQPSGREKFIIPYNRQDSSALGFLPPQQVPSATIASFGKENQPSPPSLSKPLSSFAKEGSSGGEYLFPRNSTRSKNFNMAGPALNSSTSTFGATISQPNLAVPNSSQMMPRDAEQVQVHPSSKSHAQIEDPMIKTPNFDFLNDL